MICDTCLTEYEGDVCPRCEARRQRLAREAPPSAPVVEPLAEAAPDADALDRLQGELKAAQVLEEPVVASEPAPAVGPEAVIETADTTADPEPEVAFEEEPATGDGRLTSRELHALTDKGEFVVALLGFPTAGKTWFLSRLKHFCVTQKYAVDPPPPRPGDIGITVQIEAHYFTDPDGGSFVVIDIPGDTFEDAIRRRFLGHQLLLDVVRAARAMIVILPADEVLFAERAAEELGLGSDEEIARARAQSDAALAEAGRSLKRAQAALEKADAALLIDKPDAVARRRRASAEKRVKEVEAKLAELRKHKDLLDLVEISGRLDAFIQGVGTLAGISSMLDSGKFTSAEIARTDYGAIAEHIKSPEFRAWRRSKPVFAALTKADLLLDEGNGALDLIYDAEEAELLDNFDRDPLETVRHFRPELPSQFQAWFGSSKFDFVTAFSGHRGGRRIDYKRPHYGVWAVIEWIWWAFNTDARTRRDWSAVSLAKWLREHRDGPPTRAKLTPVGRRHG